jgi:universal stress protein E
MGAVSRSRLRELFVGSTAERILDHLPCDVLVIRSIDSRQPLPA